MVDVGIQEMHTKARTKWIPGYLKPLAVCLWIQAEHCSYIVLAISIVSKFPSDQVLLTCAIGLTRYSKS